jgi:hypothetical protein
MDTGISCIIFVHILTLKIKVVLLYSGVRLSYLSSKVSHCICSGESKLLGTKIQNDLLTETNQALAIHLQSSNITTVACVFRFDNETWFPETLRLPRFRVVLVAVTK